MRFTFDPLPKGFVLSKPIAQDSYDEEVIYDLEKRGDLIITRKRDGWKLFVVTTKKGVGIYTAGLNPVDHRLDHIRDAIDSRKLPPHTLLVGEGIVDVVGNDDVGKVISAFQGTHGNASTIKLMVFGLLVTDGETFVKEPYWNVLRKIEKMVGKKNSQHDVFPVHTLEGVNFNEAKELVVERSWEGLVLYDRNFQYEFRLDGKEPKRPKGCYKWKPIMEDDFIVTDLILRPDGNVKEVVLAQIDPVTKERMYCGKLGSFTNAMRQQLATTTVPLVMQVQFDMRFPKTGKVRNQRFLRLRDDKPVHECIAPQSYPEKQVV